MTEPGSIQAGETTLSDAERLVRDAREKFTQQANALDNEIQAMKNKWQGQGGAAFFKLQSAWTEKQKIILNALREFENALLATDKDNKTTDQAQSDYMNKHNARLGGVGSY